MNAPVTRRRLLRTGTAALGAAMVPIGVAMTVAPPIAFDPAAYVADLRAIGCRVSLAPPIRALGRWTYSIGSPNGEGFGEDFCEIMQRWSGAMKACPEHGELVAVYLGDTSGVAA